MMGKQFLYALLLLCFIVTGIHPSTASAEPVISDEARRQFLMEKIETLTGVPWYLIAAMDQYERNVQRLKRIKTKNQGLIALKVPLQKWSGVTNPDQEDTTPESIRFFDGIGRDGNGDGKADPNNELDILYTVTQFLTQKGSSPENIRIRLWDYYQHPTAVDIITHIAKVYEHFGTIELKEHHFLIPLRYDYTYHSSWGARRGWGGLRIHEGTDIFAQYGTPVLSTCYGYVEMKGWNRFGGWRIGIRDTRNNYHYFAHLNGFHKNLRQGSIVQPGDVIGYVGSSGYGPPGTSGKFPPHLHYGLYKFNGKNTFSVDPYPSLRAWERAAAKKIKEERKKKKGKN